MSTPHDIADALGREAIARRLGVGMSAISMALSRGAFPAAWYDAIENMCSERGANCPRAAFAFRQPCEQSGESDATVQGGTQ